jgi:hypothetical protein
VDQDTFSQDQKSDYQEGRVIGSLEPEVVEAVITALTDAGFTSDQIEIISADDVEGIETPLDQTGLRGLIGRLLLSIGGGLERLEMARHELEAGRVLVLLPVEDDAAMHRVADILREHGSHRIFHAGRWTITVLS